MCRLSRLLLIAGLLCLTCSVAVRAADESSDEPDEHNLPEGHATVAPLFKDLFFRYSGRGYHNRLIRYRLFVPDDLKPPKKYPMIVWLHGLGDGGDENAIQLNHLDSLVFIKPWTRGKFPFFFLAVECPLGNRSWTTSSPQADDMVNVVLAAMDKTIREYPVDTSRISVVGLSGGGTGCWELAMRAPERFCALAPMASGGGDIARIKRLVGIPVWAFHCTKDRRTAVDGDRKMVAALKAAGGQACLTEFDSYEHNCWTAAFQDYGILNWLLSQQTGQASKYPPGTVLAKSRWQHFFEALAAIAAAANPANWEPWQFAVQLGIPLLLLIALVTAIKHRRHRRMRSATPITESVSSQ